MYQKYFAQSFLDNVAAEILLLFYAGQKYLVFGLKMAVC